MILIWAANAPAVGFRRPNGKFPEQATPAFDYRCIARRLLNKHHTRRMRPNSPHPRALVWPEISAPHLGICSALQPINITVNMYDHYTVT